MVISFHHLTHHGTDNDSHDSSFILRCYYNQRGPAEGKRCQDFRELWKKKKIVDTLPDDKEFQKKCGNPKYFMVGGKLFDRFGIWPRQSEEAVDFPNEKWYKCCLDSKKDQLECQAASLVKRNDVVNLRDGFCGFDDGNPVLCTGHRDRCLEVDHTYKYSPKDKVEVRRLRAENKIPKGEEVGTAKCPKNCAGECMKTYKEPECVYIGAEPTLGEEGVAKPLYEETGESEPYDVIALAMPIPLLACPFLLPQKAALHAFL